MEYHAGHGRGLIFPIHVLLRALLAFIPIAAFAIRILGLLFISHAAQQIMGDMV